MDRTSNEELLDFIGASPTVFHAVDSMRRMLDQAGYEILMESEVWRLQPSGRYYVIRNGSALLAFRVPKGDWRGFQIMASHGDSPTFKVKESPELTEGPYGKLNVEKYGGMLCASWMDRPLSVAGRLLCREGGRIRTRLVNLDRDLVLIPSLAIHINKEANKEVPCRIQKELLPLYGEHIERGSLLKQAAEAAGVSAGDVLGSDLYLYNRQKGSVWGAQGEFISSGRLDDLQCVFASLKGFLAAGEGESLPVHCVFDNEEVGSSTKQGAGSSFLRDTLLRICESLSDTEAGYRRRLAGSFMLSADNAHGLHPNYPEKSCPTNRPVLNGGIVLKYNGNQRYTTDAVSAAFFQEICRRAGVPIQTYANHSDVAGGSTLGHISSGQVALNCADIGLAQLAMHSAYETAGAKDTAYLMEAARVFYESSVLETGSGEYELRGI